MFTRAGHWFVLIQINPIHAFPLYLPNTRFIYFPLPR